MSLLRTTGAALLLLGVASAQFCPPTSLVSTYAAGNGQNGNMFDLSATVATGVTICGIDVHFSATGATGTIEVYTIANGGTYVGSETNAANWTFVGSAPVTGAGSGVPTSVPLTLGVDIPPFTQRGFYVTFNDGNIVDYTNGTAVGAVVGTDGNLSILTGVGKSYPFGATFSPRIWNGTVRYCLGLGNVCAPNPAPPYELNSGPSALDIDGVLSNSVAPAITTKCIGQTAVLTATTTLPGNPADIAVTLGGLFAGPSAPALLTGSGSQVVNVNLATPGLFFLFGGPLPGFIPHPGSLSFPVTAGGPITASAQQIVINPANVDGFDLSQGSTLDVIATTGSLAGPTFDDSAVEIVFGGSPFCFLPSVPFYGAIYTNVFLIDNGRLTFGFGDTNFFADPFDASINLPMVGVWSDLDPSAGGLITASVNAGGEFQFDYNAVPYFFSPETASFSIAINPANGQITLGGLGGVQVDSGGSPQLVGISPGGVGPTPAATDPGPVDFTLFGGSTTNATDMIYRNGPAGTLTSSGAITLSTIIFLPNAVANYDWIAF